MSEAPAMKITILTIFPEMFESVLNSSILGRARAQGILDIRCVDIRPFSDRKHKNTDDYPFGGGAGMVMLAQPILDAMHSVTGDDFKAAAFISARAGERFQLPSPASWRRKGNSCCSAATTRALTSARWTPALTRKSASATTSSPAANWRRWC